MLMMNFLIDVFSEIVASIIAVGLSRLAKLLHKRLLRAKHGIHCLK